MSEEWDEGYDTESQIETSHIEPIYEAFVCPLTKQVMQDPVTIENGQTFERAAIEKWFMECRESKRTPICPLTHKELSNTDLNPSIALRNTIEEWNQRNEAIQLDAACKSLSHGNTEDEALQALISIKVLCQKNKSMKHSVRNDGLIPSICDMLKNGSRKVRWQALETLRIVAEDNTENKEVIAEGDNVRTIVKFLSHDHSEEREKAVYLLYELSKHEDICEKIGGVGGAILILIGMTSSNSENVLTVERAEMTLENLEKCENNVRQMAESGRLQPLLTMILQGTPETQLSMTSYLGDLVLSNDMKLFVAQTVGSALVNLMKSSNKQAKESSLKALNQIASNEASANILIQSNILPPLMTNLFSVGANQLPTKLKEISANILANIVSLNFDFESIPLNFNNQTLVSEEIIHNLLHLVSNTGPTIACKLLNVLVGLTNSSSTVVNIVSAIKSSGATISLIQFVEAPQRELRVAAIKLLHNISSFMDQELADTLKAQVGLLGSLIKAIYDDNTISEEQTCAIGLLADLPERDSVLTKKLLDEGAYDIIISNVVRIRQGEIRGNRFITPYLEGLVKVLSRLTYILENEPSIIAIVQENNITSIFTDLLKMNNVDAVQCVSALSLENLSQQSKCMTRIPDPPNRNCASMFSCFGSKQLTVSGLCRVHHGICSMKETFCIVEGKAVENLVACLDHANSTVVECALAALCTLLDDDVDIEQGVLVLCEVEGIKPVLDVLVENRTEVLRRRAVWVIERILRTDEIAYEISADQNVGSALVDAFRHGDVRTRQIAEKALKHIDKLPNFSGIFSKMG